MKYGKKYPAEQLKAKFEPEKPGNGGIEFYDPNPVTEPIGTGNPKRGTRTGTGTNPGASTPGGPPE